ncbi:MAG: hypothetical protein JWQ81_2203 [Amycolatopsis sp.]|uniref:hypothetical protein n=1 Tax=Amycolatopsis sp. TaxID=37632 RepID=UPI002609E3B4|nr:hypothetical protein [Amycolatopsis sp.]MCU1681464.1 hypothetical protein [Amycolatopsis sp.]
MTAKRMLVAGFMLLAALLAGCGVQPSGVIKGDLAPQGPAEGARLYFVQNMRLTMVLRPTNQELSPSAALDLLAGGPDSDEQNLGFSTDIPAGVGLRGIFADGPGQVMILLSTDVAALSATAVDQLVCTVRGAGGSQSQPPGPATVVLSDGGRTRGPQSCPLFS